MADNIDEVAARAGVSTATVSRALRGLPNVSERTRARVERAAAELGYVVSPHASRLASGRTGTVGVVVPYVTRWFFAQVVTGAEAVLREAGLDLLLYNLGDELGRERFFDTVPLRRRVDAVLVLCLPLTARDTAVLQTLNLPVAIVGAMVDGFASVLIDDARGAKAAVQHLLNLGHRRIGLISGNAAGNDPLGEEPMHFTTPVQRRLGYREALERAGVTVDPALEAPGQFTVEGGAQAMADLLCLPSPPTAVFAESDEMAMGALRTLRRAGLRVPEDMSIIGFDGHDMADLFDLTTIVQPVVRQGEIAARLLLDILDRASAAAGPAAGPAGGPGAAAGFGASAAGAGQLVIPAPVIIPTHICIRGSTCRAPRRDDAPSHSSLPGSPDGTVTGSD